MCSHGTLLIVIIVCTSSCSASTPESLESIGERLVRTTCAHAPLETEVVPNAHIEGQMDRLVTRRCPEGRTTIYKGASTSHPNGLPVTVEIVARNAGLPSFLEIGAPIGRAESVLGAAADRAPGAITYGLGVEGIDTVIVRHSAGNISAVQWCWVVD